MDDLISRQAAIESVCKVSCGGGYCGIPCDEVKAIKQLPSVEPERMKGKWIDAVLPNDSGGLPVQVCDQCNTFFPLAYTGGGHNFCPYCGADMRQREEEQDATD